MMKVKLKAKKSFKKVPLPLKVVLNKMYIKYGLTSIDLIENMSSPSFEEKQLMIDHIKYLDKKCINNGGTSQDGLAPSNINGDQKK